MRIGAYAYFDSTTGRFTLYGGQRIAPTPTDPYALGEPYNDLWSIPGENKPWVLVSGGPLPGSIVDINVPSGRVTPSYTNMFERLFVYGGYLSVNSTGDFFLVLSVLCLLVFF